MRKVFAGLALLLMLAVVAQFFFAASGAFNTAPKEESFGAHRALGYGLILFSVLTTVAAALARVPGRLIGMTGLVAVLVIVQVVIRGVAAAVGETATAGQLIFGLHAVNGLVIMALVAMIVRRTRGLSRSAVPRRGAGAGDDAGAPWPVAGPARPGAS
jgi:Family of unknown function (DUF6220)